MHSRLRVVACNDTPKIAGLDVWCVESGGQELARYSPKSAAVTAALQLADDALRGGCAAVSVEVVHKDANSFLFEFARDVEPGPLEIAMRLR